MTSGDWVVFNLGTNDIFSTSADSLESVAKSALDAADLMITNIKSAVTGVRIGVCLTHPASSQNAFATNYGSGQTYWQYERNRRFLVSKMLERWGSSEANDIYLIPLQNLDSKNNYPTGSLQVNGENPATETIQTNGVHPSSDGYDQLGVSIFHMIKNLG